VLPHFNIQNILKIKKKKNLIEILDSTIANREQHYNMSIILFIGRYLPNNLVVSNNCSFLRPLNTGVLTQEKIKIVKVIIF